MCYSALAEQELKRLSHDFQATPRLEEFRKLFERRAAGEKLYIPKGMEANFYNPASKAEEEIAALIEGYQTAHVRKLEEDLFKQKTRLVKAERELQTKQTKKLLEDQRIATDKVAKRLKEIEGIKRRDPRRTDNRIFPGHYAPVVIEEGGIRSIIPMRYLLRRPGRPVQDDIDYSGCYNARRDNLDQFWKKQFLHTQGLIVVTSFYENVSLHAYEKRELAPGEPERNLRIQFDPKPEFRMIVACLYSHWQAERQQDLYSFAAITDEPPLSVSEAGHDRCIVPIKPQNVVRWLTPRGTDSAAMHAILADREEAAYVPRIEMAA